MTFNFPELPHNPKRSLSEEIELSHTKTRNEQNGFTNLSSICCDINAMNNENSLIYYWLPQDDTTLPVLNLSIPSHLDTSLKRQVLSRGTLEKRSKINKESGHLNINGNINVNGNIDNNINNNNNNNNNIHGGNEREWTTNTTNHNKQLISSIPKLYFTHDFNVSNVLSELFKPDKENDSNKGKNWYPNMSSLERKVTQHLDIVEVNLLHKIMVQSDEFFEGLSNIQSLQSEVCDIVVCASQCRQRLKEMEQRNILCYQVLKSFQTYIAYYRVLRILQNIQQLQRLSQDILEMKQNHDWNGGVRLIHESMKIIQEYKNKEMPIFQVFAVKMKNICIKWQEDIITEVMRELEAPNVNNRTTNTTLQNLAIALISLSKLGIETEPLQILRERLYAEFCEKIKQIMKLESLNEQPLEEYLKTLSDMQYIDILSQVYDTGFYAVSVLSQMTDIWSSALNMKEKCAEQMQELCQQILNTSSTCLHLRQQLNASMSLQDMKTVFVKSLSFVQSVEKLVAVRVYYEMRRVLLQQTQKFVSRFHQEKMKQMTQTLEEENWNSSKVPVHVQVMVTSIQTNENNCEGDIMNINSYSDANSKHALDSLVMIWEDKEVPCKVVKSVLTLTECCFEYLQCSYKLNVVTEDVCSKVVEIMSLFNTKTCELVLGAAAMRTVGLTSITAKHLALAQQSLFIVMCLMSGMEQWLIKGITNNRASSLIDQMHKCRQNIEIHMQRIDEKLVNIMQGLIEKEMPRFREYMLTEATSDVKVHASIAVLMKQCKQMHKVLNTYLPPDRIQAIFNPIVSSFAITLEEVRRSIINQHQTDTSKSTRTERDIYVFNLTVKFISERLQRLNGSSLKFNDLYLDHSSFGVL